MTNREFFLNTLTDEAPRFKKVIQALPPDRLDYKPDPKSRSAAELAALLLSEVKMMIELAKSGTVTPQDIKQGPVNDTLHAGDDFIKLAGDLKNATSSVNDEKWENSKANFMSGGWETELGLMLWGFLLDMIHHRGQLSTYIRPMGGKVPSIYGPSADSKE